MWYSSAFLSRSVSFSYRTLLPLPPVLLIELTILHSRDKEAEGDPARSAVFGEQTNDLTYTVVGAVDHQVGVTGAANAGDGPPPSADVTVSQVGLGKCGLIMTCNGRCLLEGSALL